MTPDRATHSDSPTSSDNWGAGEMAPLLSAYLDGQLDPVERGRVETWLDNNPSAEGQARREMDEIRRILPLWQAASAPEPAPEVWDQLRRQVEARAFPPGQNSPRALRFRRSPRRVWAVSLAALATAAAVLAIVAVWPEPPPIPHPPYPPVVARPAPDDLDRGPLQVLGAHEVNIISMDAGDADALAVGEDPMLGDIEPTRSEDITLIRVGPDQDEGPTARVQRGPFPMIVPVLASAREQ